MTFAKHMIFGVCLAVAAVLLSGCIKVRRSDEIIYRITSWVRTTEGVKVVHSDYRVRGQSKNNPTFGSKGWTGLRCSVLGSAARVPSNERQLYVLTTGCVSLPNEYHCDLVKKYLRIPNGPWRGADWQELWSQAAQTRTTVELKSADFPELVAMRDPRDWKTLQLIPASEVDQLPKIIRATLSVIDHASKPEDLTTLLPWLDGKEAHGLPSSGPSDVRSLVQRANFISDRRNPQNFCRSALPCASIVW